MRTLDFSSISCSPIFSSCEKSYSLCNIETPSKAIMEKLYLAKRILRKEDNESSIDEKKRRSVTIWHNFVNGYHRTIAYWQNMNNSLSVTIVNNEIITSNISTNSSKKTMLIANKLSYDFGQEQNLVPDLSQKYKDYVDALCPTIRSRIRNSLMNHPIWRYNTTPTEDLKNDINITKNFDDAYEDYNIMESPFALHINKTEKPKMENDITAVSCFSDIDLQRKIDIEDDMSVDVESFLLVSHSDVPAIPIDFVRENSISRLSNVCRNAWHNLTSRLHCKIRMSTDPGILIKPPVYLAKQHYRKRVNAVALRRGRGRAKNQLRRSGVSQTVRRMEHMECNNEDWQNIALNSTVSNDYLVDNKHGNFDDTDVTVHKFTRQTAMPMKGKPKMYKRQKKTKCATRVRYIADSFKMNTHDYHNDNDSKTHYMENLFQLRSLNSADSEDGFIVFETSDDESLETLEKQGATECPIETRCVPKSSKKVNSPCKNTNKTHNVEDSLRLRLSSESSTDSENSFIVFQDVDNESYDEQEVTVHPKICFISNILTKMSDKKCKNANSQTQKHSNRNRTLSNCSENSEDSFCVVFDTEEKSMIDDDDYDDYETDETSSQNGNHLLEDESISEDDLDIEELIKRTKKVSFDPTPIVHVMVTWDYAYRAARKGPWEEIARDNERFKGRINSIALVLDPILKNKHRSRIFQERFALSK
ncbi:hypothetical protein P5V15_009840 [Pogonomyrmex californicus]